MCREMAILGGAVIVVVWGFPEVLSLELYMVVRTLNHCDGGGGVTAELEEAVGRGCVYV